MNVYSFQTGYDRQWDAFCLESHTGTFLHTRRFLSYHADRFEDHSVVVTDDAGNWLGLLPAAAPPAESAILTSHPGITYGGVLHQGALRGEAMIEAFQAIIGYYRTIGFRRLLYKAIPHIYHRSPDQADLYALFRLNAKRYRVDLASTIDLAARLRVSQRRRRGLKKAQRAGVKIVDGRAFDTQLWRILEENLECKYHTRPVHTVEEIRLLADRFPENLHFVVGIIDEQVEAGVLLFKTATLYHAQYIASSPKGYASSALDAIFEYCIARATAEGVRWFDFGISTEQAGLAVNDGLHRFKSEFGAGSIVHEFYELDLS